MKIECSGANGETFEAQWEVNQGNLTSEWQAGSKELSIFERDIAMAALSKWADVCIAALEIGHAATESTSQILFSDDGTPIREGKL